MKIIALLLIGVALLVCGCLTPASKINAVQIGMSKDEVLKVMGPASSRTADAEGEYLNYALAETFTWGAEAVATPYQIKIVGGKVVSFGRAGLPGQLPQQISAPIIIPMAR